MPLIEELPTTTAARVSHGWAYVPDTGPAKAVIPPGSRKRGAARDGTASRADGSAKQAKIIQARLADLDKENYKDSTIPICQILPRQWRIELLETELLVCLSMGASGYI